MKLGHLCFAQDCVCMCVCASLSHLNRPPFTQLPVGFFFLLSKPERVGLGPWNWVIWVLVKERGKKKKKAGRWLQSWLDHVQVGEERERAIGGMVGEGSDNWKGQDITAQPCCRGRYFWTARRGGSARLSASAFVWLQGPRSKAEAGEPQGRALHLFCWQWEGPRGWRGHKDPNATLPLRV